MQSRTVRTAFMTTTRSLDQISLKRRVLNAGAWSLASYGLSQLIRLGSNLVMTRLLAPEMFGIMSIAFLILTALAMSSDLGVKLSVIQSSRGDDPKFLNTIWVTQIARGFLLWFIAVLLCLLVLLAQHLDIVPKRSVYGNPSLPFVIAIISTTTIIAGFQSTKLYEASRGLAIGRITKIDITAQLMGLLVMVIWALIDPSIWALVAGSVFSTCVSALLSHVWLPGTPNRWQWDNSAFGEIYHFGKWIFLSSLSSFFASSSDRFVLAGLIGSALFGVYTIAFLSFSVLDQLLTKMIADVSYPALSEIARERRSELTMSYYRFYVPIASTAYFCSGLLVISSPALIGLLYDHRYQDAGWMLQILAVALLTVPSRLASQSFLLFGNPKIYSYIHAVRFVALYLGIAVGFYWFGFAGSLVGIVLAYFSGIPVIIAYAVKYNLFNLRKELLVLPAALAGIIAGIALNYILEFARNDAPHPLSHHHMRSDASKNLVSSWTRLSLTRRKEAGGPSTGNDVQDPRNLADEIPMVLPKRLRANVQVSV